MIGIILNIIHIWPSQQITCCYLGALFSYHMITAPYCIGNLMTKCKCSLCAFYSFVSNWKGLADDSKASLGMRREIRCDKSKLYWVHYGAWTICRLYEDWRSNCTPQNTVGCNYLSLPEMNGSNANWLRRRCRWLKSWRSTRHSCVYLFLSTSTQLPLFH